MAFSENLNYNSEACILIYSEKKFRCFDLKPDGSFSAAWLTLLVPLYVSYSWPTGSTKLVEIFLLIFFRNFEIFTAKGLLKCGKQGLALELVEYMYTCTLGCYWNWCSWEEGREWCTTHEQNYIVRLGASGLGPENTRGK